MTLTAAEMGAVDFEPVDAEALETCKPPGNDEWAQISLAHLPTIRIAWTLLKKTKPELVEAIGKLEDKPGLALMDAFEAALTFHRQSVMILEQAEMRILIAGSAIETKGEPS